MPANKEPTFPDLSSVVRKPFGSFSLHWSSKPFEPNTTAIVVGFHRTKLVVGILHGRSIE